MMKRNKFLSFTTLILMFVMLSVFGGILCSKEVYAMQSKNDLSTFSFIDGSYKTGDYIYNNADELYSSLYYFIPDINSNMIESIETDNNIIKINKKGNIIANDAGIGYIDVSIKESDKYKPFKLRLYNLVYPTDLCGGVITGFRAKTYTMWKGFAIPDAIPNTFETTFYPPTHHFVGKNTKSVIELATDKNFKHIIKTWKVSPKCFNGEKPLKVKTLKKAKIKKCKTYYLRGYCYKKINNITIYSNEICKFRFKYNKKGFSKITKSYFLKFNKNLPEDEIYKAAGLNLKNYFDHTEFDSLFLKN